MAEIAAIGLFILAVGLGGGWLSYRLRMRSLLKDLERHLAEIARPNGKEGGGNGKA